MPGTCRAKKRVRQSRRRQPLSVPDPRRPPSWPAGFQGPRPWALRRGARGGSGAEATETCLGCAAATPLLLGRSAPNPRPCPQASAAKQNKLVQASCCATQSRVSRDRMRAADGRRLRSPGGRNQRAARPKPGFGGSRSPARRSRERTSPRRTPCVAQSPHRASVLKILVLSLLAS